MLHPARLVEEVGQAQPWMAQQHAWTRITHDDARELPWLWLVAVDRALGARGLGRPVRALLEPTLRVTQELGALRAQRLARRAIMSVVAAINSHHDLHRAPFAVHAAGVE